MGFPGTILYLLGPPLIISICIPLTIFAWITTAFAILFLTIRAALVYARLGFTLVGAYLTSPPAKPLPRRPPPPPPSPPHYRQRLGSSSHNTLARIRTKSSSSASLLQLSGVRDLGDVGGWKDDEEHEEALWMGLNKRLELPTRSRGHVRRHTGEGAKWMNLGSSIASKTSPLQSRTRTPQASITDTECYFTTPPVLRPLSSASEPLVKSPQHSRRSSSQPSSPLNARSRQPSLSNSRAYE